jgi:hypothetical protein
MALMIVLLQHRIGLQILFSLSVGDCLYTLWNYILQHLMYFLPPKIVCSGAITYILDLVQSNIFRTLCNQTYSGLTVR